MKTTIISAIIIIVIVGFSIFFDTKYKQQKKEETVTLNDSINTAKKEDIIVIQIDSLVYRNIWMHGALYGARNANNMIKTGRHINKDSVLQEDYNNFINGKYD